jgi:hypothetical protein
VSVRRRLFNLAAAVSLVLCVATVALWVRSYYYWDAIFLQRGVYSVDARTANGKFNVHMAERHAIPPWTVKVFRTFPRDSDPFYSGVPTGWNRLGFRFSHPSDPDFAHAAMVTIPFWFLAAASGVLPAHWSIRHSRRRGHIAGRCSNCGYDLRATPDRCPECGKIPDTIPN